MNHLMFCTESQGATFKMTTREANSTGKSFYLVENSGFYGAIEKTNDPGLRDVLKQYRIIQEIEPKSQEGVGA